MPISALFDRFVPRTSCLNSCSSNSRLFDICKNSRTISRQARAEAITATMVTIRSGLIGLHGIRKQSYKQPYSLLGQACACETSLTDV